MGAPNKLTELDIECLSSYRFRVDEYDRHFVETTYLRAKELGRLARSKNPNGVGLLRVKTSHIFKHLPDKPRGVIVGLGKFIMYVFRFEFIYDPAYDTVPDMYLLGARTEPEFRATILNNRMEEICGCIEDYPIDVDELEVEYIDVNTELHLHYEPEEEDDYKEDEYEEEDEFE